MIKFIAERRIFVEYNEKSCGCIVLDNNKVLLVKHNVGHWDFPKGHMELGETEIETAIREVKEETNIDVIIPNNKDKYIVEYSPKENVWKQVIFFVAEKIGGEIIPQKEEIETIQWFELEEAVERINYESSKDIMRKVINSRVK
ncbi:MAG: NUDIX domain-containing protein [Clostridiales bacterium]|nr:NUDIX domain-containing protein [Clostridiales bacterium]